MEENQAVKSSIDDVGEDFYEKIEAPKFVDFTAPGPFVPVNDDRYWFCSRVGCDEKHPEEMDSEVVYNNFVMRVMAARSPNVRLQRARRNLKCPLTAPPKCSKSRVARLALISSISKRIVDARAKSRPPIDKPGLTPNARPKQAHTKAMTTPRNRKLNSNPNAFLSAKVPKTTSAELPKTTRVAKALIFQSPKKDAKKKTSIETPMKTLCAAMKKLEITSAKKNVLGDGQPLPLDVSRKKFRGREVKSRVFDSLGTQSSCKRQDAKSARVLKMRSKEKNLKPPLPDRVAQEIVDEDASDMDIDEKSRHVSLQGCSLSSSAKSNDGNLEEELSKVEDSDDSKDSDGNKTSISNSEDNISEESVCEVVLCEMEDGKNQEYNHETVALEMNKISERNRDEKVMNIVEPLMENTDNLSKNYKDDVTSMSNPEEKNSEPSDFKLVLCVVEDEKSQECNREERMKSGEIKLNISDHESDDKENVVCVNKENVVASDDDIEHESETTADENVAPNDTREDRSERVAFGKHEKSKNTAKVKGALKKTVKENSTIPVTLGSHGVKSSRPKTTNPKPFKLRTDERGVLREANLGKKLNCPLKDITASRRLHGDKLQRKNQNMNQDSECDNHVEEDHEQRMLESKTPDDTEGGTVPKKGDSERKLCTTMDSQNCVAIKHQKQSLPRLLEPGKEKATKKTEKLKRTELGKIQQKVRKPRRDVSSKEEITSLLPSRQLSARKEASLNILSYKDAKKPSDATSRKRRPGTIPSKDLNLHSSHLPKSCSRKLA